ncbi:MAG: exonuclease domain-containing protein [Lachnospiraceae bacterium]|nr:exonuclease domain-containing protein [Lachnospiraceae bacterium]
MNYIVLDLEWNQSCRQEEYNPKVPFEIIEIGAVKLNEDMVMIDEFSALVKPSIYKTMHYMTGKLVHLKMQELKNEQPFEEVMAKFEDWCSGEPVMFCTWGPADLLELQRNMNYYDLPPFADGPIAFYDVQKLYAIAHGNRKERLGLETAVDRMGIKKDIPFHRAFSDAYYTAEILIRLKDPKLLDYISYDTYNIPIDKEHEVHRIFQDYDKHITRGFTTKEAMLADREVRNTGCYLCGRRSSREVKLFNPTGRFFLAVSRCDKHGFIKTKIRIRKADNGLYYAIKTQKQITASEANAIKKRFNKAKEAES